MNIGNNVKINKGNRTQDILKGNSNIRVMHKATIFNEIFTTNLSTLNNITIRINTYVHKSVHQTNN